MHFYEVLFYDYGANDPRTDEGKEFTFYCKVNEPFKTKADLIAHLKKEFSMVAGKVDKITGISAAHLKHITKYSEISAYEFVSGCGSIISAMAENELTAVDTMVAYTHKELIQKVFNSMNDWENLCIEFPLAAPFDSNYHMAVWGEEVSETNYRTLSVYILDSDTDVVCNTIAESCDTDENGQLSDLKSAMIRALWRFKEITEEAA